MRRPHRWVAIALLLQAATLARPTEPSAPQEPESPRGPATLGSVVLQGGLPETRPRLVLVLSGGGARGAAHIGVLKVLEELHVVPDLIVGTSMGSIVGGLYAAGWTPNRIEEFMNSIDWNQVFTDRVPRNDKSFRRKQDDEFFLVAAKLRFKGIKPYLPAGILGGQRLELMLRSLEFESTTESDFDRLAIPYRAVAADIATGEAIVIGEGSLATAMRASMSISGVFPPVELEGRKLVDGGAVANLPVGIAQKLGGERIVAIDISSPLSEAKEIGSFLSITNQMSGLLTVGNVQADIERLRKYDVFIRPNLGEITFTDFKRATEAVGIGEAAARARLDDLRPLAAPDEVWQAFLDRRAGLAPSKLTVDEIELSNASWVADEVVRRRLEIETGKTLGESGFTEALMKLRALDYFGTIQPDFENEEGRGVLRLDVPRKPHGRNHLQFGLSFHTDWEEGRRSDSGFAVYARHQILAVNRRGGEWENALKVGSEGAFYSRFYQPLDYGMRWFADTRVQVSSPNPTIWVDGEPVAKYSMTSRGGTFEMGRVFEHWGEIRVGPYWFEDKGEVNIGDPALPTFSQRDAGYGVMLNADTRDTTVFPRRGLDFTASYTQSASDLGAEKDVRQAALGFAQAFTRGRHTVSFALDGMKSWEDVTVYRRLFALGGLFRLSGLGNREILGDTGAFARIMYYGEIKKLEIGPLSIRLFSGFTLESGQAYGLDDPITWSSLRNGGSLFLGAETPLGPAFVGWGYTEGGRQRFYFAIGERF